ncbi:MAG: hypothetical protein JNK84_19235 [Phreatobacter sp.]|uniref:hypothetical protein n=1 Tax=Phreatobacter sp. TaxID=1966341 RepID=UPI001A5650BF|nr:hypothetical protein [Phreatobacter sp.]MBL8571213.1 hypothetical protein [Phreatobacter sp.]
MPNNDALAALNRALAAIDVMIRSGKGSGGRLPELAREARENADRLAGPARFSSRGDEIGCDWSAPEQT